MTTKIFSISLNMSCLFYPFCLCPFSRENDILIFIYQQKHQDHQDSTFHPPTPPKEVVESEEGSPTNPLRRHFSHKGEKVCSYTVAFKLEVIHYAEQSSNHTAGKDLYAIFYQFTLERGLKLTEMEWIDAMSCF